MEKNTPQNVVVTKGVTKEYSENGVPVLAVRGVDLEIARGEFTAIVGPSGSGKTTFLNLISGLDKVTGGRIWLNEGPQRLEFRSDGPIQGALIDLRTIVLVPKDHPWKPPQGDK